MVWERTYVLDVNIRWKKLSELCSSDDLSLPSLTKEISGWTGISWVSSEFKQMHSDAYGRYPFLHYACMNKNVTLEIIQYIFDIFNQTANLLDVFFEIASLYTNVFCPETEREDESSNKAYALHCACYNEHCPTSVIDLLLKRYPEALSQFCLVEDGVNSGRYDSIYVRGLPLHYYLSITSNVDIDTVKMLVEALPESLVTIEQEDFECYPIHALLSNQNIKNDMQDLLTFFIETEPSSVRMLDGYERTALHLALRNGGVTLALVKFLLDAWPEAFYNRCIDGRPPFYYLCGNGDLDEDVWHDVFQHLISIDSTFVRERLEDGETPLDMAIDRDTPIVFDFFRTQLELVQNKTAVLLPLHHALSTNACLGTIKLLVKANPVAIRTKDENMAYPLHIACEFTSVKVVQYLVALEGDSSEYILSYLDANEDSILHYACRGGNCEIVKYFLDEHTSLVSSAEVNVNGELPLHLLCEAGKDRDECDDAEHIEIIWRMLLANPEVVGGA